MAEKTDPKAGSEALDKAFEALTSYDWGVDPVVLKAIDEGVLSSHDDEAARRELETRLASVLKSTAPRAAKDFACRKLSRMGSAASVPALAALLNDDGLSHMARYALERLPTPDADKALRDALPKVEGDLKVGVINSLGVRRDGKSTSQLATLLGDSDRKVVAAAAAALGQIGTPEAAKRLRAFREEAPEELRLLAADASLASAERLLAAGTRDQAKAIYQDLKSPKQPEHVCLAASRGLSNVAHAK